MSTGKKPSLASKIRGNPSKPIERAPWSGPESDKDDGGISFSLLSRFLVCRHRFYVLAVKGLKAREGFNHLIEYGNMWHACEEAHSGMEKDWAIALQMYCDGLRNKYPQDREQIDHWHGMAMTQFPVYVGFWRDHPEQVQKKPLFQEQVFKVPYNLPSGRIVYLRGKWDAGDLISGLEDYPDGVYIQENKTKSQIDGQKTCRQLAFDLQTMLYVIALHEESSCDLHREGYYRHGGGMSKNNTTTSGGVDAGEYPIAGVRYNVVRRSAHKSPESMLKKMTEDIAADRGGEWFGRWTFPISQKDVEVFKETCLNPILENLCYWYLVKALGEKGYEPPPCHWRHPFGVFNPLDEGRATDLDEYLATGSIVGLDRVTTLFPELKGD